MTPDFRPAVDPKRSWSEVRRRTRERSALCVALLAAALACLALYRVVATTRWGMDADEAVHAVEALRLFDRLAGGDLFGFLGDLWLPERWAPPVDPHVRWYGPVHAVLTVPFFAALGVDDVAARVPSIAFLLGSCLVAFAIGRRLAPRHAAESGLLAVLLLLAAPNVLTFSAQSLTEPATLLFCFLALLAYLRSVERGHPVGRATLAGLLLGAATLTKYDHGGLLALSLGVAEIARVRGRVDRLVASGASALFGVALAVIAVWFASADKLAALGDSVRHPFAGSARIVLLDALLTFWTEYGSALLTGILAPLALLLGWRRADPGVRALWIWAVLTTAFLAARSRFHFRYNFVEAPAALLLLAVLLPGWIERLSDALRRPLRPGRALAIAAAGAVLAAIGAAAALAPGAAFDALRAPFRTVYDLRDDHFGLALAPDAYVDHYATLYRELAVYAGGSLCALGLALLVLGAGARVLAAQPAERAWARALAWTALAVALVPGAVRLYAYLPRMVEWELECHPSLRDLQDHVAARIGDPPAPATVLLGGGWDQLTNNGLRWHLRARGPSSALYQDLRVEGDMIGSLVFPPEPRIRHHARVLAAAPEAELPDFVVLVDPDEPGFLYQTRFGPEVGVYREILAARGGYASLGARRFDALGASVEVLRKEGEPGPALDDVDARLARHGLGPGVPPNGSRRKVGEGGWSMLDESLRHFLAR